MKNIMPDSNGIFEYNISSVRSAKELVVKNHNKILNPDEMLELFLHIFNNRLYLKNSMPKNADIYLDYAEHYIKTNIFSNVRINDLTKQLGITQPYLYKLFMNRYGISTAAYIRKCKLDEAKRLLIETNLTITQIANSVGYDSVMDFSKFFKKQTEDRRVISERPVKASALTVFNHFYTISVNKHCFI